MNSPFNPTLTRRALIAKGAAASVVLGTAGSLVACNVKEWIAIALKDLPVVLQIAQSIIAMIGASAGSVDLGISQQAHQAADQAKRGLETALALIQSYEANPQPGLLGQIDSALLAAQANLGSVLTVFHISNPVLQATVAAAIGSAITVVVAIQALVPPPPAASAARMKLSAPKDQSAAIRTAFNEIVAASGGPQYAIS